MEEIDQRYLTFDGRIELIRSALPHVDLAEEVRLEKLVNDAFFAGWDHGVDRYKKHLEEAMRSNNVHLAVKS
jgi:hypothetical protein